jgi:hypothetical protein
MASDRKKSKKKDGHKKDAKARGEWHEIELVTERPPLQSFGIPRQPSNAQTNEPGPSDRGRLARVAGMPGPVPFSTPIPSQNPAPEEEDCPDGTYVFTNPTMTARPSDTTEPKPVIVGDGTTPESETAPKVILLRPASEAASGTSASASNVVIFPGAGAVSGDAATAGSAVPVILPAPLSGGAAPRSTASPGGAAATKESRLARAWRNRYFGVGIFVCIGLCGLTLVLEALLTLILQVPAG